MGMTRRKFVGSVAATGAGVLASRSLGFGRSNGDVFPCDFQVARESQLGNIMEQGWEELLGSPRYLAFRARKGEFHPDCAACEFLDLCGADCVKYRGDQWRSSSTHRSVLCDGWRKFFNLAVPRLQELGEGRSPWV